MSTNGSSNTPLRVVVGSDNAGHTYKTALKEVLSKHSGVTQVLDVGVVDADDGTAYPHLAVDACKKIKSGEVCQPLPSMKSRHHLKINETNTLMRRPTAPS